MNGSNDKRLFVACFTALIATAFGFIVRAMIMDEWAKQFGLSETQKGEIFGVGLWPFAISIVLFSLIVDKIGYGKAMLFAFVCHSASMVITICAPMVLAPDGSSAEQIEAGRKSGYWMLYVGNFIVALGNGTVEAVINPVVATMFSREKTKWLNILHAGWPGGLVLGGVLALGMGPDADWRMKVGLLGIPVILYGIMMATCRFPVSERVAAGVPFRDMLKEVGFLGAAVVTAMIVFEVARVLEGTGFIFSDKEQWGKVLAQLGPIELTQKMAVLLGITGVIALAFGMFTMSAGRPMFFFLLVIMIPLATTELGTDSWITGLMEPEMKTLGVNPGWVLVYTSFIMMVLRFFAGPIVHALSPLGLLAASAAIAAVGLVSLSYSSGIMILLAATLYGFGKTFFWPTMLGVVSEQFPKGGALTLNGMGGVGMLGVGVVGAVLLGNIQDKEIDQNLKAKDASIHTAVAGKQETSVFGTYQTVDDKKVEQSSDDAKKAVKEVRDGAKKSALKTVAIFPVFMLVCYLILILYFKARGGYRAVDISHGGGH
jgi:MFS family permease